MKHEGSQIDSKFGSVASLVTQAVAAGGPNSSGLHQLLDNADADLNLLLVLWRRRLNQRDHERLHYI